MTEEIKNSNNLKIASINKDKPSHEILWDQLYKKWLSQKQKKQSA